MKKCPFCGQEFPDDVIMCPTDRVALDRPTEERKKVTGSWQGVYGYGATAGAAGMRCVPFTLGLKQDWTGHFTGSVTDDGPDGIPGTGSIDGYFEFPTIEFTKQMPVAYIVGQDGMLRTLREHILAKGRACERELAASPIHYRGTFLDANRVQGTWTSRPRRIPLPDGPSISIARSSGYWCAQIVPAETQANVVRGPSQPLFDKSLLSQRELDDVEGLAMRSIGKFSVPDAEKFIESFEREGIRFDIDRDDTPIQTMPPILRAFGGYSGMAKLIELFIHPEDLPRAEAIINRDAKT